ncbi:MAG: hypothetical protein ACJA0U_001859 [Salibacteraceae bacterium]|jgi:hypothetical protein
MIALEWEFVRQHKHIHAIHLTIAATKVDVDFMELKTSKTNQVGTIVLGKDHVQFQSTRNAFLRKARTREKAYGKEHVLYSKKECMRQIVKLVIHHNRTDQVKLT